MTLTKAKVLTLPQLLRLIALAFSLGIAAAAGGAVIYLRHNPPQIRPLLPVTEHEDRSYTLTRFDFAWNGAPIASCYLANYYERGRWTVSC